ncbi:MAG: FAD-dependent oxidoreductase [Candidatus Micrarchaeota archaeon]|nr:FAD-dependent oxidoreductase [Candidatus Micrarchaeota archaeon]
MPIQIARFVVKEKFNQTADVVTLRLVPLDPFNMDFKPGQFVNLYVQREGEPLLARPYSIASSPTNKDYLELTIKIIEGGRFTPRVASLKIGDVVKIGGPFGKFFFLDEEKMKDVVLIGGGCGITPFISIIRYVSEKGLDVNITYFYSARTMDSILYRNELESIAKKNKNIKIIFTCTREGSSSWNGERGRINLDMIKKYVDIRDDKKYYMLCGPPEMIKSLVEQLKSAGINEEKIIHESWSA